MSGWPILDVAIGLSFVYLLLSTICTALTEGITTQLRSRSKYLERGIEALLGSAGKEAFFAHPLIASFTSTTGDSPPRKMMRKFMSGFASKKSWARADLRPSYLPGDKFALVAREIAEKTHDGRLVHQNVADNVNAILRGVATEAEKNKALQVWYDQVMERVGGWYKRYTQVWVRILAVVAVVVLNADTIHITNVLWSDPTVRQVAVEQAKARLKQPPPEPVSVEYTDADETLPDETPEEVGTAGDSSDKHLGVTEEQWQLLNQLMSWDEDRKALRKAVEALQTSNAAAKFAAEEAAKKAGQPAPTTEGKSAWGVYWSWVWYVLRGHWLGWFLSMVAVSLGAPFWYGALNNLVNIRNAGAPAKKKEEKATA
jgi:hypothetical protein